MEVPKIEGDGSSGVVGSSGLQPVKVANSYHDVKLSTVQHFHLEVALGISHHIDRVAHENLVPPSESGSQRMLGRVELKLIRIHIALVRS